MTSLLIANMDKKESFMDGAVAPLREFAQQHQLIISVGGLVVLALAVFARAVAPAPSDEDPPMMRDTIPYISNTYQFLMGMDKLLIRAV